MAKKAQHQASDPEQSKTAAETVVEQLSATSAHGALGDTLVARISTSVKTGAHADHPGSVAHRKGFSLGENVKSLAHIYTPWANLRANGSGILAVAAWRMRLESEGKSEVQTVEDFTRGLTHR